MIGNKNKYLSVSIHPGHNEINIGLHIDPPIKNTGDIPQTYNLLKRYLPSVLNNECFNDNNYSFREEVKQTEVGHLFEHLILEYLCLAKINNGSKKASFSGRTSWSGEELSHGDFKVKIKISSKDLMYFDNAMQSAAGLLEKIIDSSFHAATDSKYTIRSRKRALPGL